MFSISITNVLTMLFDISSTDTEKGFMEFEDDGTSTVNAMVIPVHISVSDFSDGDQDREARDSIYVMYAGRHSIFYAHARDADGNHRNFKGIPVGEWENTSNHDSCWRSDGFSFLNSLYFNMSKEANDKIAPCDLHDYTSLGSGRNPVSHTTIMLRTMKDGYRREIVKVN